MSEEPTNLGEIVQTLASAMIPPGTPTTPPDIYRAHIFKTEICPAMKGFGFERRFWQDHLFENAKPKTNEAKQRWTMGMVKDYLRGVGAIVVLPGKRGVGKTTLCAQIAIERLWEDWHSAITGPPVTCRITSYKKLTFIVEKLKGLYGDFGSIRVEEMEAYRDFLSGSIRSSTGGLMRGGADLLIVDEINEASEQSRFRDKILTDIVDRRYAQKLDTILITNQTPDEFEQTINASILSRSREHGAIIPCEWESFRDTPTP